MADTLKDIPEFFETELGESIAARTDALGKIIYSAGRVCVCVCSNICISRYLS